MDVNSFSILPIKGNPDEYDLKKSKTFQEGGNTSFFPSREKVHAFVLNFVREHFSDTL